MARRGADAYGLSADADKWWSEATKQHAEGLTSDNQKRAFNAKVAQLRLASMAQLQRHENSERRTALTESTSASIVSSINMAAANPNDPDALGTHYNNVSDNVAALAELNGWTPERARLELDNRITQFHRGVIEAQVDTNPGAAQAYYEANKDEIEGTTQRAVEKQLRTSGIKMQSQAAAEDILAKTSSLAEAIEVAQDQYSGELEDAVVLRVERYYTRQQAAKTQDEAEARDSAWRIFNETGSIDDVPASVQNRMDPTALHNMRMVEDRLAKGNYGVETDYETFTDLVSLSARDPEAFLERTEDVNSFRNIFAQKQFDQMVEMRRQAAIDIEKPARSGSDKEVMKAVLKASGFNNPAYKRQRGMLETEMLTAFARAVEANDGPLTQDQAQSVADGVILTAARDNPALFPSTRIDADGRTTAQRRSDVFKVIDDNFGTGVRKTAKEKFARAFDSMWLAHAAANNQEPTGAEENAMIDTLMQRVVLERDYWVDREGYLFEFVGTEDFDKVKPVEDQ